MGDPPPPQPVAEGDLSATPFLHVVNHLLQHELSGSLVLWPTEPGTQGQHRLLFERGWLIAARLLHAASSLDLGVLPFFHAERGPYAFYRENLVGTGSSVLVGHADPLTLMAAALRGGVRETAVEEVLSRLGSGRWRIVATTTLARFGLDAKERSFIDLLRAEPDTVPTWIEQSGDPKLARRMLYLLAITRGLEAYAPAEAPRPSSAPDARPGGAGPASPPGPGAQAAAAGRAVFQRPRESAAPPLAPPPAPPSAVTGSVSTSPASEARAAPSPPPGGEPPPPPPGPTTPSYAPRGHGGLEAPPVRPAGLVPEHARQWDEIVARAASIENEDYFTMLSVPRSASDEQVRTAYFTLAKTWHPDRLPVELKPLSRWVDRIFHYFTEARDTLSDLPKRGRYLQVVQDGGGTPASDRAVQAIVQAAVLFQKVEVLVRSKDWAAAREALEEALSFNDEEADYHATYAWILFHTTQGPEAPFTEMLLRLDRAIQIAPRSERAHYYRGVILRAAGRGAESLAEFKQVAEINPKNIDAQRELRLASMRGGEKGSEKKAEKRPSEDGLLSKLFGAKKK